MPPIFYVPITGLIQSVCPFSGKCCSQFITLSTDQGIINFVASPETYIVNNTFLLPGMRITAFYDPNQPVPLIYPPQYRATVISPSTLREKVIYGYFDKNLLAIDESIQLNISPMTNVVTANGQRFSCPVGGYTLLVFYSSTTRSIPPQTTPRKVIVMC